MQFAPWRLVVAEICKPTGLPIEAVGPVRIGSARIENDQLCPAAGTPAVAKSALISNWQQPAKGVIADVPGSSPLVVGIYN